jgi:CHAD domain-containing protein
VKELPTLELRARYFDTDDLTLARNGITLRHRTGDESGPIWTMKLPVGDDGVERDELESDAPARRPPVALTGLVRVFAPADALRALATVKTRRRRWSLQDESGDEVAELALDDVVVLKERKVADRWREVELESKSATRKRLESIGDGLSRAGARPAAHGSKGARALGFDGALQTEDAAGPDPSGPAGATVHSAIATALRRLERNDPRARLGEAEGVHQMRVAARRLRSDLKTFAPLVDAQWARSMGRELKWLGTTLGEVRDLDVLLMNLRSAAPGFEDDIEPLFGELAARAQSARKLALEGLDGERYISLVASLREAGRAPALTDAARQPGGDVLPPLVEARWNDLTEAVGRLHDDASPEDWHEVRILAKRTRYAAEAIAPSLGRPSSGDAASFARLCSRVQDTLGDYHDAFVAIETLTSFADGRSGDAPLNRAVGRLIERQFAKADSARDAFWKQWARIDRKKNLKWLTRRPGR